MIRADLHIHTSYSFDASINPKTLVEQLNAHPTVKAIAITDHNTVEGYFKVRQLALAYPDLLIIPGVEISAVEGDLLVLGTAELPPKPWNAANIIDFGKERGALIIAAHPYRVYGLGDSTRNLDVDAIEVLNGSSQPHLNKMAENLAKSMGLPGIAGSDAHHYNELWTAYTEIQASLDVEDVLKAIKNGLVRVASNRWLNTFLKGQGK